MDTGKRKKRLTKTVILLILSVCMFTRLFSDAYAAGENTKSDANERVTGINIYSDTANTTDFAGGTGTQGDPYLVSTAAHFNNVRNFPRAYYRQTADIDLGEFSNFATIGTFWGVYDGNGHTLNNITMTTDYAAIFGWLYGTIQNLGLLNGELNGTGTSGGLCHAMGENAKVLNCYNKNVRVSAVGNAAGLVGKIADSPGLVIRNCYNQATISSSDKEGVGGIVGSIQPIAEDPIIKASIENCYNSGTLFGAPTPIGNYSTADVTVMNCYYDSTVLPDAIEDGSLGLSTDQMKSEAFVEQLGDAYIYQAGDYPTLNFQQASSVKYIYSADDFVAIDQNPYGYYVQMAHIDLSTYPDFQGIKDFRGTYDGNGYTLSNVNVNYEVSGVGLFRSIWNATIKNLGLLSGTVRTSTPYTSGVLVASAFGHCKILNCYNLSCVGDYTQGSSLVGKIYAEPGRAEAEIIIRNCYNQSNSDKAAWGMLCWAQNNGGSYSRAIIENCYSAGKTKTAPISSNDATITKINCYYDQSIINVASTANVTGKTTEEMKDPNFPSLLGSAYVYKENGYPILANQRPLPGEEDSGPSNAVLSDLTIQEGETAVWKPSLTFGTPGTSFEWYRSLQPGGDTYTAEPISRELNYTLKPTKADNGYRYKFVARNASGVTSATAVLNCQYLPALNTVPDQLVNEQENVTFAISIKTAGNPNSYTYQWQQYNGSTWTNVGTNAASLALNKVNGTMNGYKYRCVVTSAAGSVTSNEAVLKVRTAPGTPALKVWKNNSSYDGNWSNTGLNFTMEAASTDNSLLGGFTLQYKIGNGNWTNYPGSAVPINTEGETVVYGRSINRDAYAQGIVLETASQPASSTLKIDTKLPSISKAELSTTAWTNQDVTLAVTAADSGSSGLSDTAYSFDGGSIWQASNTKTYQSFTEIPSGTILVRDKAGNTASYPTALTVKIDKTVPELTVFVQEDGTDAGVIWSQEKHIQIKAVDTLSGIVSVILTPPAGSGLTQKDLSPAQAVTGTEGYTVVTDAFTAEGTYHIRTMDSAGNTTEKSIVIEKIDRIAAQNKDFTFTTNAQTGELIIRWKAADVQSITGSGTSYGSGIAKAEYALVEGTEKPTSTASWTEITGVVPVESGWTDYTLTFNAEQAGKNTYIRLTDRAGNISEPELAYESKNLVHAALPIRMMYAVIPEKSGEFYAPDYTIVNLSGISRLRIELTGAKAGEKQEYQLLPEGDTAVNTKEELRLYLTSNRADGGFGIGTEKMKEIVLHEAMENTVLGTLEKAVEGENPQNIGSLTLKADIFAYGKTDKGEAEEPTLRHDCKAGVRLNADVQ